MDRLLLKKGPNLKPGFMDKKARAKAVLERVPWPSIKGKIELLNCNLDQMKSTLTPMLNVIIYAQQDRIRLRHTLAEQRQLIEILAQAKEERDKALEQAKRAVDYKSVEPSNDIPYLTAMNFMAMSVDVEKSELSQGSNNSPLVPSQTRTLPTKLNNSSHLDQLLDEYTRLQKNLIDEINSEQYKT
ncbi:hypothetical protein MMC18_006078 [Xylographa bjoerkii]|nr:hypothetical protein [Xylographa bjoerkii]